MTVGADEARPPNEARHGNVRRYRERMRARGFRPIQIWVPDTRSAVFAAECRRQSMLVAGDHAEESLMDALEPLQDVTGWSP
ncbi:MAG: antitoxin MazE family protein [Geminicoccaceae bacterium]|nr:antitoxin MazE family protein [Geminicoccaceae bacterium]